MSWDQRAFLVELKKCVDAFDHEAVARLCDDLVREVHDGAILDEGVGRDVLSTLRRKSYFDQMARVAEALHLTEQDDPQIRRQYAQSLIDRGNTTAALYVLEALVELTKADPKEHAEARGLLGRLYKQLYVNAVNPDRSAAALASSRRHLQRSIDAYVAVYCAEPTKHLWHGINVVAIAARAKRDGVPLSDPPDPGVLAGEILDTLERNRVNGELDAWSLATGAEAWLARGDTTQALTWLAEYVQRKEADAFELASTIRQLKEVWGLTIDTPPGALLLPLLESQLLARHGGRVKLAPGAVEPTIEKTAAAEQNLDLEKVLGHEGVVTLGWYKLGLERSRSVAKILDKLGDGFGTGFLIRGGDLVPALGDEVLLLTNAHVVSNDPAASDALDPADATIVFEALEQAAGQEFKVRELLWTSPPKELDASLLRLDRPVPPCTSFPIARRAPLADGRQKVYVIGHPGGRALSISLNDNLLLDLDDRLLHYRAPTEGGSSGSPVFNQQWDLIGLHHAGGDSVPRLNGKDGTYPANEGIWIRRIMAALADAGVGALAAASAEGRS